jgi:anti-sigma factor RsiW
MNVHEDKKAALSALLDGELSDAERAEVLAHLDACEECRVYYAELCALHDAMGDLDEVEVPENFAAGVLARLHEDAAPKKKPAGMWRKWGALAACAAVVVLAAAVLPNALNSKNTQEASVAAPKAAIAPESAENTRITTSLMAEPAVGSVGSPDEGTEAAAEE